MDFVQLRHFVCVAEQGSLSAAAIVLGLTQPGLTKSVRKLEESVGSPLLARRPRGVELTEAGRRLLAHARMIELQIRDAQTEIRSLSAGHAGVLAIGAGPSWLSRHLPPAVVRVLQGEPGLKVRVVGGFNDRLLQALDEGRLDVVVAAFPEAALPSRYASISLASDVLQVIAREGHPLARRRDLQPRDILDHSWVLPGRDVASRTRLDALFLTSGMAAPEPVIESDSISFILATLRASDHLSFATSQLLFGEEAKGIVPLDLPRFSLRRDAGLIFHRRRLLSPAAQALVDELRRISQGVDSN